MVPHCYTLTELTRRVSENRRVVIHGFDVRRRTFLIFLGALLPGLVLTALAWPLLGEYAIVMFLVAQGLAFFVLERQSQSGLQLRTYRAFIDARRAAHGRFFMCSRPFDPNVLERRTLIQNTVPVPGRERQPSTAAIDDLFGG